MESTAEGGLGLLQSILTDDTFHPAEPTTLDELGVSAELIASLILKYIAQVGSTSGRDISHKLCVPFNLIAAILHEMRTRQLVVHKGHATLNDYLFALTEQGQQRAKTYYDACAYVGPVPVPLEDYVLSVEAQAVGTEPIGINDVEQAFDGLCVEQDMLESLGPAVNSGAGLFLYGAPGNGKTTLAQRITRCFGQDIWIPRCIVVDGVFINYYDSAFHEEVSAEQEGLVKTTEADRRWIKIKRPTVVVGGELTLDNLEVRHDPITNVSEAALQMKSNCGCLLIDDFGRQRVDPTDLLNRWIVPLENKIDFQSIASGKKIQIPFEQLIIFSTNLEPSDLADDAFLRRIPYKVEVGDPSEGEFHKLFKIFCNSFSCEYDANSVQYLIETHYYPKKRPLRRCQPRDLLTQIRNLCAFYGCEMTLRPEFFDRVVNTYFTVVKGD